MQDCPYAGEIGRQAAAIEDVKRRLAILDGNHLDKTGGAVGRMNTQLDEHEKFLRRLRVFVWVGVGGILAQGGASLLLLRAVTELVAKMNGIR